MNKNITLVQDLKVKVKGDLSMCLDIALSLNMHLFDRSG